MAVTGRNGAIVERGGRDRLFLVADDLTGALDAAARFASPADPVAVTWSVPVGVPARALALDSGTREVSPAAARAALAERLRHLPPVAETLFYAKLDSLLRGNAAAELAVWLEMLAPDACIIAPAFPFQGRVTIEGRQHRVVDGRPVPVACDLVAELEDLGIAVARARPGETVKPGVTMFDAATDEDLAAIVAAGRAFSGTALWCGSGGLAAMLADATRTTSDVLPRVEGPVLGLFGTDHPVTAEQIDRCGEAALAIADGGVESAEAIARRLAERGAVPVRADLPTGIARDAAARRIDAVFTELVQRLDRPGTLVVAGGETLRGLGEALGADGLALEGQIVPGVPVSRFRGGRFDGLRVVSKSGAFGEPDFLLRLFGRASATPLPRGSVMIPQLAVTMGDPAGVGPEIIVKACKALKPRIDAGELRLLIIGSNAALEEARRAFAPDLAIPGVEEAGDWPALAALQACDEGAPILPGVLSTDGGRFAYHAVEVGVRLALAGRIHGIVTAPLNKEALNKAGFHFAGHTDMLAHLTGAKGSVMMLAHGGMRVSHVTTHVALQDVPKKLTKERLRYVLDLTEETLAGLGLERRRIAVAALNPHAGEGGLFGREDIEVSTPVIAECVAAGRDVVGPVPGDTVFVKLHAGQYDAVVAMYHDQGHIPVKLLGFNVDPKTGTWESLSGVNITLGLPIIRTSVDHGTAFDIAGKGIANELSLLEAIDYAEKLAAARVAAA